MSVNKRERTLAAAADEETMSDLIALLRERRHGENRIIFIKALARSRSINARQALEEAKADPELVREITRVLSRRGRRRRKET